MAEQWVPLPLSNPLHANTDESAVMVYQTAIENGFINDMGGHSRFPGLKVFARLPDKGRVYLHDFQNNLVAGTSRGRLFSLDPLGRVRDRTGAIVTGGNRIIYAKAKNELHMAAGGPIVRLRDETTDLLSEDAPLATHVGYLGGYTLAAEVNSDRWYYAAAGLPDSWDPLDTFAADSDADPVNSLLVTPFGELMLGGSNSIEQFEASQSGDAPFFRRWSIGDGIGAPYCLLFADNAVWSVNKKFEVVRASGQVPAAESTAISQLLEKIDDWSEAWMGGYPDNPLHVSGQKFILLQIPNATNAYGTKGVTLLLDYRAKKWFTLYGFNVKSGEPERWPGWSHWSLWNRTFVGGEGVIYEVDEDHFTIDGAPQRWLLRTGYMADGNGVEINGFRLMVTRGHGGPASEGSIMVRCRRDHRPWSNWIKRGLGRSGQSAPLINFGNFGQAHSFQFEIMTTDDVKVDLMKAEILPKPVGH